MALTVQQEKLIDLYFIFLGGGILFFMLITQTSPFEAISIFVVAISSLALVILGFDRIERNKKTRGDLLTPFLIFSGAGLLIATLVIISKVTDIFNITFLMGLGLVLLILGLRRKIDLRE